MFPLYRVTVGDKNLHSLNAEHKYPYDWRTKKPTIFRATEQWFASVEGFREAVMDAIGNVKWIPAKVLVLDCIIDLFCSTNMPC